MKHFSIIALAVGCMISTVDARAVDWKSTSAIRSAAQDQQFLLYFHSKDSPLCRELDEDIWSDPTVTQASGTFMPVMLDCGTPETKPMLARFQVYRVPTIVIGRRDGSVVRRLERASEKDTILKFLRGEPIPVAVADSGGKSAPSGGATLGEATDPAGDASPAAADIQGLRVTRKGDDFEVAVTLAPAASGGVFSTQTVYINVDNSATTGFASSAKATGAEYMIQAGALFHFNGQKQEEWAWEQKGPVATRIEENKIVYVLPSSAIGKPEGGFSLFVSTQNEKWDALDWAPDSAPLVAGAPAAAAKPEASPTPGAGGEEVKRISDPKGDAAPEFDITGLSYSSNRETVTVTLELANPAGGGIAHVFIDPDADPSTGYGDGTRNGADFMIEGASLYRHESAGWNWKVVGEVKPTVDGTRVTFAIPRSRVGLEVSRPGRYWFTITDKAWAPADFIPDNDTITIP